MARASEHCYMMTSGTDAAWVEKALSAIGAEARRSGESPLGQFPLPPQWGVELYLKDESTQPTGSLKHHLARALFGYALSRGELTARSTVVDASSGSTAVSEAYFARMLGLRFVAVVPRSTSQAKLALVERFGGSCEFVDDPAASYQVAEGLGAQQGWHYLDQFGRARRALGWCPELSLTDRLLAQLRLERHPLPAWIVVGAGTGGTSANIGYQIHHHQLPTRLAVVDPEGSAFYPAWCSGRRDISAPGSLVEGIGRPRVEPSFAPEYIHEMFRIPDATSFAACHLLRDSHGIWAGGSTGTNLVGALILARRMRDEGRSGSIVTLIADRGDRYLDSVYDKAWLDAHDIDIAGPLAELRAQLTSSRPSQRRELVSL